MVAVLLTLGLASMIVGAGLLVRGASRLAGALGVRPLVIGLTVVAFGTSAPELAVSVRAALSGQQGADIALGNVVGSNVFNVLFILGIAALIIPLRVARTLVRIEVPIMIGVSLLLYLLVLDRTLDRLDASLLLAGALAYTGFTLLQGRKEPAADSEPTAGTPGASVAVDLLLIAIGLAFLVFGSDWLVGGATQLARSLGVSELVIGLTIVGAGTSLPEAATSIMASIKGERDIAVGNVIGSNIFNILAVLGLSGLVAPAGITVSHGALAVDLPVAVAVAVVCLPVLFTGYRIGRTEGALFLTYYAAYIAYVILATKHHDALDVLSPAMLFVVLPCTAAILLIAVWRQLTRAEQV